MMLAYMCVDCLVGLLVVMPCCKCSCGFGLLLVWVFVVYYRVSGCLLWFVIDWYCVLLGLVCLLFLGCFVLLVVFCFAVGRLLRLWFCLG